MIDSIKYYTETDAPYYSIGTRDIEECGGYSTTIGMGLTASEENQIVIGKYNAVDNNGKSGDYSLIVGNGSANDSRSNAFTIDYDGNAILSGAISSTKTIIGNYYITDNNNTYAFIIGNGTANNNRSNAFTIDYNGNTTLSGIISSAKTIIGDYYTTDNNNTYAMIIGNGTSSVLSNALAVTWDGTLHGAKVQHNTNSTFELNGFPLNGMVTTNTVYLELTTERFLDTVSTITVDYLTGGLRGVLGYLDGTTYNTNWKGSSSYTITAEKKGRRHIVIIIAKKSGNFTNMTQNTPVCFYASTSGSNIGLKLTFS